MRYAMRHRAEKSANRNGRRFLLRTRVHGESVKSKPGHVHGQAPGYRGQTFELGIAGRPLPRSELILTGG
jgi:hypothetical protein